MWIGLCFFRPWKDRDREDWNGIHGNSTTRNRFHIRAQGLNIQMAPSLISPYRLWSHIEEVRSTEYMVLDCVLTRLAQVSFS